MTSDYLTYISFALFLALNLLDSLCCATDSFKKCLCCGISAHSFLFV